LSLAKRAIPIRPTADMSATTTPNEASILTCREVRILFLIRHCYRHLREDPGVPAHPADERRTRSRRVADFENLATGCGRLESLPRRSGRELLSAPRFNRAPARPPLGGIRAPAG
jgi:hypothetical protein